jgi:hypothetical protein
VLLETELRGFVRHKRSAHLVPLLVAGVVLSVWIYPVGPPFVPVVIVVAAGLELEFNNIFFRTPNEVKAMLMFPIPAVRIILAKNIATLLLALGVAAAASMALLYFSPAHIGPGQLASVAFYLPSVLFSLLVIGNERSIRNPRPRCGLQMNDLLETIWMLVYLGLVSIPFFFCSAVVDLPVLGLAYGIATALYWYRISIPRTAARYEHERSNLCLL